jgi:transposase-like protein
MSMWRSRSRSGELDRSISCHVIGRSHEGIVTADLRKRRPKPHTTWHLDEVYLKIDGRLVYLWRAVDSEGEVLDFLVQTERNKAAALKLMWKLLKKYGFIPDNMVTDDLRSYHAAARELGSSISIASVDGETTGRRIRINPPDDENARCKISRASGQHRNFSQLMQQSTTSSTSNATSQLLKPTDDPAPKQWAHGARRLRPLENARDAGFPRSLFDNVTKPRRALPAVHPSRKHPPAKVRAFVDFCVEIARSFSVDCRRTSGIRRREQTSSISHRLASVTNARIHRNVLPERCSNDEDSWLICRCGFPIVTISRRTRARYRPGNEAESSLRCRGRDFETIPRGGILVELPRD